MTGESIAFFVTAAVLLASGLASAVVKRTFHSVMFLGVFLVATAALYILLGSPLVGIIQVLVYVGGILTLFVFAVMFVAGDESEAAEVPGPAAPRGGVGPALAAVFVVAACLFLAVQFTVPANRAVGGLLGGHYVANADGQTSTWQAGALASTAGFAAGALLVVLLVVLGIVAWIGLRHALDRWSTPRLLGSAVAAILGGLLIAIAAHAGGAWGDAAATEGSQALANDLDTVVDGLFGAHAVALEILGLLLTAVMVGALVIARPLLAPPDAASYATITREQLAESQAASDVRLHTEGPP